MKINIKFTLTHTHLIFLIGILAFVAVAICFMLEVFFGWDLLVEDAGVERFYAGAIIVLTILLLAVAWFKFGSLNNITQSDFLLRIDERFSSREIMRAREIVHEIYLEDSRIDVMADKILDIADNSKKSDEFIHIINFIDFLETIAYFCNKDRVSSKAIEELTGGSITYYYKVFKKWIERHRHRHGSRYYSEIERLAKKIDHSESID